VQRTPRKPAKYVAGTQAVLSDPDKTGWYVHCAIHDRGDSGPGFIWIHPQPPYTTLATPAAEPGFTAAGYVEAS
jgi:hypothetical protein